MEKEQLQERKERILECMKSPAYVPMKRKDMRVLLGVPEEDRTYFEQIIAELIDEGKIFETKRGKLAVPETLQMATGTFISHAKGFGFVTRMKAAQIFSFPHQKPTVLCRKTASCIK